MLCVVRRHYLYVRQVGHMPHRELYTNRKTLFRIVRLYLGMARRLLLFVVCNCIHTAPANLSLPRTDVSLHWSFICFPLFLIQCTTHLTIIQSDFLPHLHLYAHYYIIFFCRSRMRCNAVLPPSLQQQCNGCARERNKTLMFSAVSILMLN